MKKIVLGTAGHIDHGKTTLIKKLTGTDCDRLKEEKKRGITIELGFAALSLPNGQKVGIVDVPGHEKFIKNMVAGAGGIDGVILVIAADEGVMPQTREHLDICSLLSVKYGIIALTKADLVDMEWLALVTEDLQKTVKNTFLEKAPIVPVSAASGTGIDKIVDAISAMVANIPERPSSGTARLPVDRVFSMKGFGTVVTGTLSAGKLKVGDEVEILPEKVRAKVRGVQVHGDTAETVTAGQRTALNLQGIDKTRISRGNLVCHPGTVLASRKIDIWFHHLSASSRPLKNRSRIRFHSGTSEILGRAVILGQDEIKPGENGFLQIFLEKTAPVFPGDSFVIRSYSPVYTIGGGKIMDCQPEKHKRLAKKTISALEILKQGSLQEKIHLFCQQADIRGTDFHQLQIRCGTNEKKFLVEMEKMLSQNEVVQFNKNPRQAVLASVLNDLEQDILKLLQDHHRKNPMKMGLLKEEIRTKLPKQTHPKLYSFVCERLLKNKKMMLTDEFLALPGHKPRLKTGQQTLKNRLLSLYKKSGITPPTRKELVEKIKADEKEVSDLLGLLTREKTLIKLSEEIYYEKTVLDTLVQKAVALMDEEGQLTIQRFKDLTGLSRKFMIPFFEYLDRTKITFRKGDIRVPRKSN